ncbi:MAG: hypothetical protein COT74_11275 [Bdellovibrionales bacterium CG10_big_fil_rev_8_21_14_0_10_45_34]|nr:MAG: hypothetical protein COT74_11275 [Bdellovibrionales bacterium CG10_big_fil_rev_8_21_14_0_10_45_34]
MKILITGASGFLGSHVAKACLAQGHKIFGLTRSPKSANALRDLEVPSGKKPNTLNWIGGDFLGLPDEIDGVIHCATSYGRKGENEKQIFEANLDFSVRIFELARKRKAEWFINIHTLLDPETNLYSAAKHAFNNILKSHTNEISCISLACENFYGPGEPKDRFVTWLIDECLMEGGPINLSSGGQFRDFVYIDDVVEAILRALELAKTSELKHQEFAISGGKPLSIREIAEAICEIAAPQAAHRLKFGAKPDRKREFDVNTIDLPTPKNLGWEPKTGLIEGLKKSVEFERKRLGL